MSEFTEIILRLLWRFYPIAWLTTAIARGLSTITSWLEDEESLVQLAHDPKDCAYVGGWLALAEERLNELIVMKAMKLLKRPYRPPDPCGHHPARAVKTPQEIYRRLCRLCVLYHDHKRLYELRARNLQRLFAKAELQLEAIHHPVESTTTILQFGPATTIFSCCSTIPTTTISRFCSPTTIFSAQPIRGPPWLGFDVRKLEPIPTRRPCLREREIMLEAIQTDYLLPSASVQRRCLIAGALREARALREHAHQRSLPAAEDRLPIAGSRRGVGRK